MRYIIYTKLALYSRRALQRKELLTMAVVLNLFVLEAH